MANRFIFALVRVFRFIEYGGGSREPGSSTTRYRKWRNAARRPALAIKLLRETQYRVNDLVAGCRALLITFPTTCS